MNKFSAYRLLLLAAICLIAPHPALAGYSPRMPGAPDATIQFTIVHTNDVHGQLEQVVNSVPGMARLAWEIANIRASRSNVLLLDAGDQYQGSLLANFYQGAPMIQANNLLHYNAATIGNHEFDWGLEVMKTRLGEANYPFLAANVVLQGSAASCASAGWDKPDFIQAPYKTFSMTSGGVTINVAVIGVTTTGIPSLEMLPDATKGLCFKDPSQAVQHYYDQIKTANLIVVLSHLGFDADKVLAASLNAANQPVDIIVGGHSHTQLATPTMVGNTRILQAYYGGLRLGRADITYDTNSDTITQFDWAWTVSVSGNVDATMDALVKGYVNDTQYQSQINRVVGYTSMPLTTDAQAEAPMADLVMDAIYTTMNQQTATQVDMVLNNSRLLRSTITGASYPAPIKYGKLLMVMPFGNQLVRGQLSGAQIMELLNRSAKLPFVGVLQVSGLKYKFYNTGTASGAYDVQVWNKSANAWEPLQMEKIYTLATSDLSGQDGYTAFTAMQNKSQHGAILALVDAYITARYGTQANAYAQNVDGRIIRTNEPLLPTSTPTPTARPSSTPTPTPTTQPSSTPTPTPTAQPSSTPTPTPTSLYPSSVTKIYLPVVVK